MTEREKQLEYQKKLRERRRRAMRRKKRRRRRIADAVSKLLLFVLSLTLIALIVTRYHGREEKPSGHTGQVEALQPTYVPPNMIDASGQGAEVLPDASFKLGSVGDVILHTAIIQAYGGISALTTHDFSPIFSKIQDSYGSVDYMVANLEVSLGGAEKEYTGFPTFNVPDEITINLRDAGVDLQLLANNHIYDTGKTGFLRTISVLQQNGIEYTGARASLLEPRYLIKDINGIRVGFVNYTYETEYDGDRKSINGNIMDKSVEDCLNSFEVSDLEAFYSELAQIQAEMQMQGVEFTIMYIHWGNEYELDANDVQKAIAARLCDMGIDAVIGSHPHVVQPVEVLMSSDGTHKMFCAYSLGNHLSNQRRERIKSRPNGHTEDGLMLNLTISRVNGQVSISGLEVVPTYVYMTADPKYYIIPIYQVEGIEEQTGLSGIQAVIQASYDRTMKILGDGIEDAKRELGILME